MHVDARQGVPPPPPALELLLDELDELLDEELELDELDELLDELELLLETPPLPPQVPTTEYFGQGPFAP